MSIEETKFLYEVLVRLGPDGFRGAHVVDLRRVWDTATEEIFSEKELAPRPITEAEVGTLLGGEVAGLIEQLDAANAAVVQRDATIEERDTALAAAEAQIAALTEKAQNVVSRRQMKLALYGAGILDDIEAFVATADRVVQISWTEATEFHRSDGLLNQMAAAFGLTSEQVDQLFAQAATL